MVRSPEIQAYDDARLQLQRICERLEDESGLTLADSEILTAYSNVKNRMRSNCDSVAQGLFTSVAGICAHRPHLASSILPDPLQPLYYLGIEDLEGIKKYIRWLIDCKDPYYGRTTESGYQYLRELAEQDAVIVGAFRSMFSKEENGWREEDEDVPAVPPILNSDGGASTPAKPSL